MNGDAARTTFGRSGDVVALAPADGGSGVAVGAVPEEAHPTRISVRATSKRAGDGLSTADARGSIAHSVNPAYSERILVPKSSDGILEDGTRKSGSSLSTVSGRSGTLIPFHHHGYRRSMGRPPAH